MSAKDGPARYGEGAITSVQPFLVKGT